MTKLTASDQALPDYTISSRFVTRVSRYFNQRGVKPHQMLDSENPILLRACISSGRHSQFLATSLGRGQTIR